MYREIPEAEEIGEAIKYKDHIYDREYFNSLIGQAEDIMYLIKKADPNGDFEQGKFLWKPSKEFLKEYENK